MAGCFLEGPLFGDKVKIFLDKKKSPDFLLSAYGIGKRLEKTLNFYNPESELSRLNKNRRLKCSKVLLELIKKSVKFSKISKGSFDVSKGKNFIQRKAGKSLTKVKCSYRDIAIDGRWVILKKDALIDLGSIAKGRIADEIVKFLEKSGISGYVDARGDIRVFGPKSFNVRIRHPRENKHLFLVKLKNESIATSGDYNQKRGSFSKSHILNQKDLVSVSVVSKKLEDADVFATVVFTLNAAERENLIKKNKNLKVLTINKDFKINFYNGFENLLH